MSKLLRQQHSLVSKPTFQAIKVFDSNLAAVQLYQRKLNKPIVVDYSVLEMAKKEKYGWFYDVLLKGFSGFNVRLLMSDTDSCLVHIENKQETAANSFEDVLHKHRHEFDLSAVEGHLQDRTNKEVPGKMKI